ncbi:hypothetical protein THIOSC13_400002 [uncultured Thiomicrorhabdus sp.]|jgi:CheY-like chemotaxis protein
MLEQQSYLADHGLEHQILLQSLLVDFGDSREARNVLFNEVYAYQNAVKEILLALNVSINDRLTRNTAIFSQAKSEQLDFEAQINSLQFFVLAAFLLLFLLFFINSKRVEKSFRLHSLQTVPASIAQADSYPQESLKESNPNVSDKEKTVLLELLNFTTRTQLASILGTIQTLKDSPSLSAEQKRFAESSINASRKLKTILDFEIDYLNLRSGDFSINQEKTDLVSVLARLENEFRQKCRAKNLDFFIDIGNLGSRYWMLDARRFKRLIKYYLNDSLENTEKGFIHLFVRSSSNGKLFIEVRDSGSRLKVENTGLGGERCSEMSELSCKDDGTTLIEFVCCQMVKAMGGEVDRKGIANLGNIVSFSLQLTMISEDEFLDTNIKCHPLPKERKFKNILIVEDDLVNQMMVSSFLRRLGYSCFAVDDGSKVLDAMRDSEFDLILMDCHMQGVDGFEAAEKVRIVNNLIPIVALSADISLHNRERCFASGMNDFLEKPIKIETLSNAMDLHLF